MIRHYNLQDDVNKAIPKPLIAEVQFTLKHHIHLVAVNTTTSDPLLKSGQLLEDAIRTCLISAPVQQKEVVVVQVVIYFFQTYVYIDNITQNVIQPSATDRFPPSNTLKYLSIPGHPYRI